MKRASKLAVLTLLATALGSTAAEVDYQHPTVTIIAKQEPLESVLTTVSEVMDITVTSPVGLNPLITADIREQPIARAFKQLLGDLGYSLIWSDNGEQLTGLVILADGSETADNSGSTASSPVAVITPPASGSNQAGGGQGTQAVQVRPRDERDAEAAVARAETEARMAEERAAHEKEMEARRMEEEVAQEARRKEDERRHRAEAEAYLREHGVELH